MLLKVQDLRYDTLCFSEIISDTSEERGAIETSLNIYQSTGGKVIDGFHFQNVACISFLAMFAIILLFSSSMSSNRNDISRRVSILRFFLLTLHKAV